MTAQGSRWPAVSLALRSATWTVLLPGVVAGYLPWRFFGLAEAHVSPWHPVQPFGVLCIGLGAVLLGTCIWEFARSGRGTLSPVDPPRDPVVRGLYRYVRNPMYVSASLIVLGEFLLTWSRPLLEYWVLWFIVVNLVVIGYEEPSLHRRFGVPYGQYTQQVGRWVPRLRSGQPRRG